MSKVMDMEAYLNKVCKSVDDKRATVNHPKEKKYCTYFVKGDDGYCINYIKPEPIESIVKLSNDELMAVKVYKAAVVSCSGQCKVNEIAHIGK